MHGEWRLVVRPTLGPRTAKGKAGQVYLNVQTTQAITNVCFIIFFRVHIWMEQQKNY